MPFDSRSSIPDTSTGTLKQNDTTKRAGDLNCATSSAYKLTIKKKKMKWPLAGESVRPGSPFSLVANVVLPAVDGNRERMTT